MSAKKNPSFLPDRIKEVYEYRGMSLWELLKETKPPGMDFDVWKDEYKRDRRKGKMSDPRLEIFAKKLNCDPDWLRGAFPGTAFDPDAFNYDARRWSDLMDDHKYINSLKDLIFMDLCYPGTFTYKEIDQLTEADLKAIFAELNPIIKSTARRYIEKYSEE